MSEGSTAAIEETADDIPFSLRELHFSAILDISFTSRALHNLSLYSSKVNGSAGVNSFFGYFFSYITLIQILVPSVLINSLDLWPPDSIITQIFRLFAFVFDGPSFSNQESRLLMSLVLSLIYLVGLAFIFIRSFYFAQEKLITKIESFIVLFVFKFLLMFFLPLLLSGLPVALNRITNGNQAAGLNSRRDEMDIEYVTLVFVLIAAILYFLYYYFFLNASVLLINSPMHEFIPLLPCREFVASVCPIIASCVGYIQGKSIITFPIIISIIYLFSGIYTFVISPNIKQQYSLVLSASELTAAVISIIQAVNIILLRIDQVFIIIALFAVFIVIYFLLFQIHRRRVLFALRIFDECIEKPEDSTKIMEENFKSDIQFLYRIIPAIDQWHPFLTSWKLFDNALMRFPNNFHILLLYGRLLSFFPQMNSTMLWVASQIAKIRHPLTHAYFMQFRLISQVRQRTTSFQLKKKIDEINERMDVLLALMRRFWENILQKNTTNFWEEVNKIARKIKQIDSAIVQLTDDYPNSADALHLYFQFTSQIKHNYIEAKDALEKISLIERFGYQKSDIAMSIAIIVFPNIEPYLQEFKDYTDYKTFQESKDLQKDARKYLNSQDEKDYRDLKDLKNSKSDTSSQEGVLNVSQMELAMQELTKYTKLGRVWPSLIICTIMTAIVIVVFILFEQIYIDRFITQQINILSFMSSFGRFTYKIAHLDFMINLNSMFITDTIHLDDNTMHVVAPNLYTRCHDIQTWRFNTTIIQETIDEASILVGDIKETLYQLSENDMAIYNLKRRVDEERLYNDLNFESSVSQLVQDCEELIQTTDIETYLFSNQAISLSNLFESLHSFLFSVSDEIRNAAIGYHDNDLLDALSAVVVILAILLVSVPFIIQLYILNTQNLALSDSFAYFPNTEIRAIITKFGMSTTKREDDSTYIAQVTQGSNVHNLDKSMLLISFFSTFLPITICCIIMHFIGSSFLNDATTTTLIISTLYNPQANIYIALVNSLKISVIDVLGFGSVGRDNLARNITLYINNAEDELSSGLWGNIATINSYYSEDIIEEYISENGLFRSSIEYNYYDSCFQNELTTQTKTLFELLASYNFPLSIDLSCGCIKSLSTKLLDDEMNIQDTEVLSLYYFFSDFLDKNRNTDFFYLIEWVTGNLINHYLNRQKIITIIAVLLQCASFALLVIILLTKHYEIKNSLRFYHDLSPVAVTQNSHAMKLLDLGIIQVDKHKSSFSNAEMIITKIPQGVVLIDRQLTITDVNEAFLDMVKYRGELTHLSITDIIFRAEQNNHSWPDFVQHMSDSFIGRYSTQFVENVTVKLCDDSIAHFLCNVVCLAVDRPAVDGDNESIEKIAIVISDCTDEINKRDAIEKEQEATLKMISNIIPSQIASELINGEENLSFVAQSVTIGEIDVTFNKQFGYQSPEIFLYLSQISELIDSIIKDFDLLCKVRSCGDKYIFAGGLFSRMAKPERHADQAIQFSLKVIEALINFDKKFQYELVARVGIHTGGPVIAGIMSASRPNFQIIGPVLEVASQIASQSLQNQIHITRSVYELIYSYGFRVHEKGETMTRSGNVISTYLITLQ